VAAPARSRPIVLPQGLIFAGPIGVGKATTARALAMSFRL
jgi:ATP-dependent Clp protease ATP-binding subunit ClpA